MTYWGDDIRDTPRRRRVPREQHPAESAMALKAYLAVSVVLNIALALVLWGMSR